MFEVRSRETSHGNQRVTVYANDEIACDITVSPDGKIVTLGMDGELRSGAMPVHIAARPNWARFRYERKP